MTSLNFLQLLLVLHITGFTMMAGTVLADFAIFRRLSRYLIADKQINGQVEGLRQRLGYIYVAQLILFLTIFILSVLKF